MVTSPGRTLFVESRDGTKIAYCRIGSGRPLVTIHGALGGIGSYAAVAEILADGTESFLYDRRGRGLSGWGREAEHSLQQETDDAEAILDIAGPRAVVLGHSFGGAILLDLLARRVPVAAAVLYEPAVGFGVGDVDQLDAARDPEEILVEGFAQLVANGGITNEERGVALAAKPSPEWDALIGAAPTLGREMVAAAEFEPDGDSLQAVNVPALVIVGSDSTAEHRDICERIAQLLPRSQLQVLEGQGHVAHVAAPELLAGVVDDFIRAL